MTVLGPRRFFTAERGARLLRRGLVPHQARWTTRLRARAISKAQADDSDDEDAALEPPKSFKVIKEAANQDVETLVNKYRRGELNLKPGYQRGFVWDLKMSSGLVLTVLKGLPIPQVMLHEVEDEDSSKDDRLDVIDGKQRLTSLLAFVMEHNMGWSSAPVKLDLAKASADGGAGEYMFYHGKRFRDLPSNIQKGLLKYTISVLTIGKETDDSAVFEMYKALNAGGVKCSDQQLRRAAFWGKYIKLLDSLAQYERFKSIRQPGQSAAAQKRSAAAAGGARGPRAGAGAMRRAAAARPGPGTDASSSDSDEVGGKPEGDTEEDQELILRFFAMSRSGDRFRAPMVNFLNNEIRELRNPDLPTVGRMEREFKDAVDLAFSLWGPDKAFRKYNPATCKYDAPFNKALWDSVMAVLSAVSQESPSGKRRLMDKLESVRSGFEALFGDDDWNQALSLTTAKNIKLRRRKLEEVIDTALPAAPQLPRTFSQELKQRLFNDDPTCRICNNAISSLTDAEVDHIEPWSRGGQTVASNAQLVHRTCNRSKGNREGSDG